MASQGAAPDPSTSIAEPTPSQSQASDPPQAPVSSDQVHAVAEKPVAPGVIKSDPSASESADAAPEQASSGKKIKEKKKDKMKAKASKDKDKTPGKPRKKRKQGEEDKSPDGPVVKTKKKKEKGLKSATPPGSNPARRLPTAQSREKKKKDSDNAPGDVASSMPQGYSAQQAAVNDMMRRALEEDQYSALGSVVDTDSSSEDESSPHSSIVLLRKNNGYQSKTRFDRNFLLANVKKHMRVEGLKSLSNFNEAAFLEDAEEYCAGDEPDARTEAPAPAPAHDEMGEELASDGKRIGKRKKKKKRGGCHKRGSEETGMSESGEDDFGSGEGENQNSGVDSYVAEDNNAEMLEEEESSIFGQTTGSSNATWVECDRCKKWRRLRGVVDARKLPSKWFCSMNKNDPERAKCSAQEEEYDSAITPESAMDQRTRKHLRLWVRRLHCNESYENRTTRGKRQTQLGAKEPYEWIRCCSPSCGKWRMLLRSMDGSSIVDQCKNREFYCVMNTWDEKAASCGAAQENLPTVGCPPWVMLDED